MSNLKFWCLLLVEIVVLAVGIELLNFEIKTLIVMIKKSTLEGVIAVV